MNAISPKSAADLDRAAYSAVREAGHQEQLV